MTIYVDDAEEQYKNMLMCHMFSDDSIEELQQFAAKINLRPEWMRNPNWHKQEKAKRKIPHYALSKSRRADAVANGATEVPERIDGKINPVWASAIEKARALKRPLSLKAMIARAKQHPDQHVCEIVYRDGDGKRTRRVISPISYADAGQNVLNALCLTREAPRNFVMSQIEQWSMIDASSVLMPIAIIEINEPTKLSEKIRTYIPQHSHHNAVPKSVLQGWLDLAEKLEASNE